jgi:hypothetical protein
MIKPALHVADDAAEDAVADQLPLQRGGDRRNERIAVGRVEGGGGVGDGEELRLTERDRHSGTTPSSFMMVAVRLEA